MKITNENGVLKWDGLTVPFACTDEDVANIPNFIQDDTTAQLAVANAKAIFAENVELKRELKRLRDGKTG